MTDCAMKECFTPAVPRSPYCAPHTLMRQRVRGYMTEAESEPTSKPTLPTTDTRIHILSTLREWLRRVRR